MLIALMENASWKAVADALDEGYVTVGRHVNIRHLAATPLGQQVRASAELIEIDKIRLPSMLSPTTNDKKLVRADMNAPSSILNAF